MSKQQRLLSLLMEASRIYCENIGDLQQQLEHIDRELQSLNISVRKLAKTQKQPQRNLTSPTESEEAGTQGIEQAASDKSPVLQHDRKSDPLLTDAMDLFVEQGLASVSSVQRRFRVGYSRAARIVDQLEVLGCVGMFVGSQPREVLMNHDEWLFLKTKLLDCPDNTMSDDVQILSPTLSALE